MAERIHEDKDMYVTINDNPVCAGHVRIYPKQKAKTLDELPKEIVSLLFQTAMKYSTMLFEGLKAQGTNIILNETDENLNVNVIARFENDGLNYMWEPKQGDQAQITQTAKDIADKIVLFDPKPKKPIEESKPEKIEDETMFEKNLFRIP